MGFSGNRRAKRCRKLFSMGDRLFSKDRNKDIAILRTAVPNFQTFICISQVSAV